LIHVVRAFDKYQAALRKTTREVEMKQPDRLRTKKRRRDLSFGR